MPNKERSVDYALEIVDEIPGREHQRSPLEDALDKITAAYNSQPEGSHKPITAVIGWYTNGSAASAAANVLRQKHGDQAVEGWRFETRRVVREVKGEEGEVTGKEEVTGLYVNFDPTKCVPGAREMWDRKMAEREVALEAKRKAREAAAGTTQQPTNPPPSPQPQPTQTTASGQMSQPGAPVPPQSGDAGKTPSSAPKPNPAQPAAKK